MVIGFQVLHSVVAHVDTASTGASARRKALRFALNMGVMGVIR